MLARWLEATREMAFHNSGRRSLPSLDGPWRPNELLENCPRLRLDLDEPDGLATNETGDLYVSGRNKIFCSPRQALDQGQEIATLSGAVGGIAWDRRIGLIATVGGTGVVVFTPDGQQRVLPSVDGQ